LLRKVFERNAARKILTSSSEAGLSVREELKIGQEEVRE